MNIIKYLSITSDFRYLCKLVAYDKDELDLKEWIKECRDHLLFFKNKYIKEKIVETRY